MDQLATWVLTYLLHSSVIIGVVALIVPLLRRRPEVASVLWKAALLGGLVTATLQVGVGVQPWPGSMMTRGLAADPVPHTFQRSGFPLAAPQLVAESLRAEGPTPPLAARTPVGPAIPEAVPPETPESSRFVGQPLWTLVLAMLPVLGLVLAVSSVAVHARALARRLRGRVPVHHGSLARLFGTLLSRAGTSRTVALSMSPRVAVPMATGVVRGEVVLPPRVVAAMSEAHQETLIAHELAHVLRRDPLWRVVGLIIERLLFFQPLNRLATGGMAQAAEYLCDDWAAHNTGRPFDLARCLTEVAGWSVRDATVMASAAVGPAARSTLGRRVQRLLEPARALPSSWRRRTAATLAVASVVGLAWIVPGVATREASAAKRKASSAVLTLDEDGIALAGADDGESFELVLTGEELSLVAQNDADPAADPPAPTTKKEKRRAKREAAKARRKAKREVRQAFRQARKQGRAAPDPAELEAIARRARAKAAPRSGAGESFELRIIVPEGGEPKIIVRHGASNESLEDLGERIERDVERALERAHRSSPPGHSRAQLEHQLEHQLDQYRRHAERAQAHARRKAAHARERAMKQMRRDRVHRKREVEALRDRQRQEHLEGLEQLRHDERLTPRQRRAVEEYLQRHGHGGAWPIATPPTPPTPPAGGGGARPPAPPRPPPPSI